jgi:hypothetical protein
MNEHLAGVAAMSADEEMYARPGEPCAGKDVPGRNTLPQGTVKPGTEVDALGPRDWDDFVLHTGEARGVADTAHHSLQPDAPTVPAAERGLEIEKDQSVNNEIPSSSLGPA